MFSCYSKTLCITKSLDSNSQTVKSLHFASCVSSCMNINVTVVKFVRALSFRCQLTQSHSIYYSKKCKVNGAVCQNIWCEMWYLQKIFEIDLFAKFILQMSIVKYKMSQICKLFSSQYSKSFSWHVFGHLCQKSVRFCQNNCRECEM